MINSTMRIGFDLDNIFIDTPPLIPHAVIERLYGKKSNGILQYRIPSRKEQLIRIASHAPLLRPPLKANLEFLQHVNKAHHQFFLVSSRFGFLRKRTEKIVKKYKLDKIFDELYFNFDNKQPHIFKSEVINRLKLDRFVDDDLYLLKYIASKNNSIKLFWFNKKVQKKISPSITAITQLSDMFSK